MDVNHSLEMKITPEITKRIEGEILRLSLKLHEGVQEGEEKTIGFLINQLMGIIVGFLTIDDFHDKLYEAPDEVKEYYLNLLH